MPPTPQLNVSGPISLKSLLKKNFLEPPTSERESSFASVLMGVQQAKYSQDLAADTGKKEPFHKGEPIPSTPKVALQSFELGPRVRIITPGTPPPDEMSLLDFARSQGIDENVIRLILESSYFSLQRRSPDRAESGLLSDPTAEFSPTISNVAAIASEAKDEGATAPVLFPPGAIAGALGSRLTPPSWATEEPRSENIASLNTSVEPFRPNNESEPTATTSEKVKPTLPSVKVAQLIAQPLGLKESTSYPSLLPRITADQSSLAQSGKDTPAALPGSAPPITRADSHLDCALLGGPLKMPPAGYGEQLLGRGHFGGALGSTIQTVTAQEVAGAATAALTGSAFAPPFTEEAPSLVAPPSEVLPATETGSLYAMASKNPRDLNAIKSLQEVYQPTAAQVSQSGPQEPMAGGVSMDGPLFRALKDSPELNHAFSAEAAVNQSPPASRSNPANPETIQDTAIRRSEQQQLLADRVLAAIGHRISSEIAKGTWQFDLQLHPSHLGKIDVRLSRRFGGDIDAEFSASETDTKDLLVAGLPKLKEVMAASGIGLYSLNVSGGKLKPREDSTPSKYANSRRTTPLPPSGDGAIPGQATPADYFGPDGLDVTV